MMKRCKSVVFLIAAVCLVGCDEAPRTRGTYDLSVGEAYERLSDHELPELVFAKQCGILIHVTPNGEPDRQVTWRVTSSGREVVRFTALLTSVGEKQTKVEVQMPPAPGGGEAYDGSQTYVRPAFNQPLRPAVEEQIAAILEGRKFDVRRVGPGRDSVCNVQRAGLESGVRFRIDDEPGMDASQSAAANR